jgi:hypothetical protein
MHKAADSNSEVAVGYSEEDSKHELVVGHTAVVILWKAL